MLPYVFVKTALQEVGSFTFLAARFWLAFMVAVHILLVDRQAHHHDPLALGTVQIGAVALLSGPPALLAEPPPVQLPPVVGGAILFTALPATALALLLQVVAQRRMPPMRQLCSSRWSPPLPPSPPSSSWANGSAGAVWPAVG